MPRVTRGTQHVKRRKNLLKKTKGMMWGRKSKIRLARVAELKAGKYAYRDRRVKKRTFRQLWQVRLNAAVRPLGLSYSRFMDGIHKAGIELDRKILSTLAKDQPQVFEAIVAHIKK
ncbi:50S ribosomal protein L20 [Candidatus Uhrbacteria bacterium RIFOXYB12_FULL_58_10]|uniref:Large ribosomal subunit protein bL20 n=1 Tax=Candidatus Uhrbacteria bacterium RIFOXYB2_FULL_57_15 TaxID=1802422 RepID=A0A1F7W811_9BACT|nr:MAG: 50S ribosomal protein L20 [Candidatus Uhrbacteria bacterium RIFOXYB12_FULL_58_10]OGL98347.1 MAG: 50S ribosomal protein L20 [Candidatus Uhrbacteria bacterium RIFOXYB2_FULL_57_15]OGM00198.1 MAG: 50S ribosomal protein L20 [Candidatus Uhrbacteria bacterium RIFOXYC12_FULL_57_11]